MEPKKSPEHRISIKIGLIFLVIILFFTGLLIYSSILRRNIVVQREEMDNSHRILSYSNQLITSVQHAQDVLNAYLVAPKRGFQLQYDSISTDIASQIDHIQQISPETNKEGILSDIDSLLSEKNRIVNKLIRQFRLQNPLIKLDKRIETYDDNIQDTVVVTTNKDTTLVTKQKKDFWSRLKNLFDPKYAPDTTMTIAQTEQEVRSSSRVDTVMYADLKTITQEASKTYSSQISGIEREVRELIYAEQTISLRISQLITQFYNEAIETTRKGTENSESLTQRIFTFAIVVGALSIAVILFIIFLIIEDLNNGKKARIDLAKEKQITEELIESRHKLLLSVSHDIKTPLSSMMGYLEIFEADELSEEKKRQIDSARNSGKHILSMLKNLLEFSRLERNSAALQYSRFNLVELIEEIIHMFQPFTDEKALSLQFENRATSPFFIRTDYTILKQILINVLSNAVKYTLQGSVTLRLEYGQQLIFTVIDTGIGIDEGDIENVFKPFSRIKNPLKTEGSGFGMYVTKGMVESLNGDITLTSIKEEGTSVTIRLPLTQIENLIKAADDDPVSNNRIYNKILLFEDDPSLGNMIKEFLIHQGFRVKLCSNRRDVLGFLRLISSFDIVFTDMQMVDITGNDILREIRKRDSSIPVWLMTANDEYVTERARQEGFTGLVLKPVKMSSLQEILSGTATKENNSASPVERFSQLASLFDNDKKAMKDILSGFVQSCDKDMDHLTGLIDKHNFKEAQQLCHRIYPFFSQLEAENICEAIHKMDNLRGRDETSYPEWKEELSDTIRQISIFTESIRADYL